MCSDWVIYEKYPQKPPCRFDYDIVEMIGGHLGFLKNVNFLTTIQWPFMYRLGVIMFVVSKKKLLFIME
jgi:hypothetical protein